MNCADNQKVSYDVFMLIGELDIGGMVLGDYLKEGE